jgi:hypothetical protein
VKGEIMVVVLSMMMVVVVVQEMDGLVEHKNVILIRLTQTWD